MRDARQRAERSAVAGGLSEATSRSRPAATKVARRTRWEEGE